MFSAEQTKRTVVLTALAGAAVATITVVLDAVGQHPEVVIRGVARPVPVGAVVLATAAGGLAAHVLARLADRTTRPRRTFLVAVVVGLALSAVPPWRAATTTSAAGWLLLLHAVVAVVLVPPLARALPVAIPAPPGRRAGAGERRMTGGRR